MIGLRGLDARVRPWAEYAHQVAAYYGLSPRVTSTFRSWQKQAELRARYEACLAAGTFPSRSCPYPANRPGDSAHNYGLAWDSVIDPADQAAWDEIRRWVGFDVPENDRIHGAVPNWRSLVR